MKDSNQYDYRLCSYFNCHLVPMNSKGCYQITELCILIGVCALSTCHKTNFLIIPQYLVPCTGSKKAVNILLFVYSLVKRINLAFSGLMIYHSFLMKLPDTSNPFQEMPLAYNLNHNQKNMLQASNIRNLKICHDGFI